MSSVTEALDLTELEQLLMSRFAVRIAEAVFMGFSYYTFLNRRAQL